MSESRSAQEQHRAYAPTQVRLCVLTVSDSRGLAEDRSGEAIERALESAGHKVVERGIVRDELGQIRDAVLKVIARADVDAAIVTGGTGVSPRDSTPEAIEPLIERRLEGFGELFRSLSFQEIGPAAMLSRALAGTARRTALFVLPGSVAAVRLGLERLILPELGHLIGQLRR